MHIRNTFLLQAGSISFPCWTKRIELCSFTESLKHEIFCYKICIQNLIFFLQIIWKDGEVVPFLHFLAPPKNIHLKVPKYSHLTQS